MDMDHSSWTATVDESRRHGRVLVAEDNGIFRLFVTRMLEEHGFVVDGVTNGRAAIAELEKRPYDFVLMDVQMPELDGLEATCIIRSGRSAAIDPAIPIFAMTALTSPQDRLVCVEAGMSGWVDKPVSTESLRTAIRSARESRRKDSRPTAAPTSTAV